MDGLIDDAAGLHLLTRAVASGVNQTLEHSETLPPAAYTSPAFYALERERILQRGWLCVGHVSQLPAIGDYLPLDLFGELLVIVRAEDRIRVMSRVCLHRWAPLVNCAGNTKVLSCPFHKWGFALDGRLLGAPLMDQVAFDPAQHRLPQYPTEIVDGFIYMSFDADAPSLAPQLAGLSERLAHFRMDELVVGAELTYDCAFNWKIAVETFMECYHHIAAHPETFEKAFPARLSYGEDSHPAWTAVHAPARAELADTATVAGFPLLGDLSDAERREFCLYLVYPFHMLNVLPDRIYWFRMQPDGPDRTLLQTSFLVRPEARALPNYDALIAAETRFMDDVNVEDISVNVLQQRGAASPTAAIGRLSHLEKAVWQLADYVRAGVADAS